MLSGYEETCCVLPWMQILPQVYLGETQQWFPSRKYQHEYAVKTQSTTNGIAQHITRTNHEID